MRLNRLVRGPILVMVLIGSGIALSCSGGGTSALPECEDGRDNDGDLLIDELDPSCVAGHPSESDDPIKLCVDGIDNDGDGLIDFPADPGCTGPTDNDEYNAGPPACSDGVDNDGDTRVDFPADPGCLNGNQDSETDGCADSDPNTPCPQCGDGVDNDADTRTDYPNDSGCTSASDDDEFILDTSACGVGTAISFLPDGNPAMVMGMAGAGLSNVISPTCQGRGQETVYVVRVDEAITMVASTDSGTTTYNTVLYVREACRDAATELACNDDISPTNNKSKLTVDLTPGVYFLVVDARDLASAGNFALTVNFYRGPGEDCAGPMDCAPGYVCRAVAPSTQTTCEHPVCSDGRDDDADGHIDFPNDPGCDGINDGDEADDCPSGPNCPQCGDEVDNDLDGDTDYPADVGCRSANGDLELDCSTETDPLVVVNTPNFTGTTLGAHNDQTPTCGSSSHTAPDVVHYLQLQVPVQTLTVTSTNTWDSAISLVDGTCTTSLVCTDFPNSFTRTAVAPGDYAIVIDGWSSGSGAYSLNVRGDLAIGADCDDPLVAAGVLLCPSGFSCQGAAGSATCQAAACNDAIDTDGDTFPGYPSDPGCSSPSDNDESDDCPGGPNCPVCSNDLDDDSDGQIDWPIDVACAAASGTTELGCPIETDPLITITGPNTSGTTVGASNSLTPTCGFSHTAPERVHILNLPVPVATLNVNLTSSFDAATSLTDILCGTTIQCSDPNSFTRTNVAAGAYAISVDGWSSGSGTYTLNVVGDLLNGGRCEPSMVASGLLRCPAGTACGGAPGTETCHPAACNDAIDADADGFPGYPSDPGCASSSDDDETDNCPSGPGCPQCSNDLDDDGDTLFDFPIDTNCVAAGDNTELGCGPEAEDLIVVTGPTVSGTTASGATDNLDGTCASASSAAADRVHLLSLAVPVASLVVTTTAGFDAVTYLMNGTCGTSLQCQDFSPISVTNLAAGNYGIVVDGWSTGTGTYALDIHGQLNPNGPCNDPLVAAGVLSCPLGYTCGGAPGAETCQPAACNDAIDADGDGFPGYPSDPGCASPTDTDETDACPSGPGCPACSNDLDDDSDTAIDWPADFGCGAASSATEVACAIETDAVTLLTGPATPGTTVGASNSLTPTCGSSSHTAPERVFILNLPVSVPTLSVNLVTTMDAATSITDVTCGSTLVCSDGNVFSQTNVPAGAYAISVDGWGSGSGAFTLNVVGDLAAGGRCDPAMTTSGLLRCPSGFGCSGVAGAEVCQPAACNSAADEDGDGFPGYPTDPGCTSPSDATETDDCPSGPGCPVCANTSDDDTDALVDYPTDYGCVAASGTTELPCPIEPDPITLINAPTITGTTVGAANNFTPVCQTSSIGDKVHMLQLPVPLASLHLDTNGSALTDTVLLFMDAACGQPPIACDDDGGTSFRSIINRTNVPAGNYAVAVDTYGSSANNSYVLHVSGTVAAGTACTGPLFTAGVLTCAAGSTCNGTICQ